MIWLLANRRLVAYGLAVLAIVSGVLWLRAHWISVGEARQEARYEAQRDALEAEAAKVRAADALAAAGTATTLERRSVVFAELANRAPTVLTQTRYVPAEVKPNEPPVCPVVTRGESYRLRYNEAATVQAR